MPQEKGSSPILCLGPSPREDELEAGWGIYALLQRLDDGDYPTSDAIYKEFSARLWELHVHKEEGQVLL